MKTRDEIMQQFGPMLLEALMLIIKDEINLLRAEHGLLPRTNEQILNAIDDKLQTLPVYDWVTQIRQI